MCTCLYEGRREIGLPDGKRLQEDSGHIRSACALRRVFSASAQHVLAFAGCLPVDYL